MSYEMEAAWWKVEAERFEARVKELKEEIKSLKSQLPGDMQECTIVSETCKAGHVSLRGLNWIKVSCPWCKIAELEEKIKFRDKYNDLC